MKKILIVSLVALSFGLLLGASAWAQIQDPANLHVGPGAGSACPMGGCPSTDPNTIGGAGWDVYYNTQGNGNLAIGDPFYLIVATPIVNGSTVGTPSVNGSANLYAPFPGPITGTVTINGQNDWGAMSSGDIYTFLGLGSSITNSFSFTNMSACDTGGSTCPNAALHGSAAPLSGDTISGFDITTWNIGTTTFAPGDLLDFTGSLPVGSYVAAIGVVQGTNGTRTEGWAVPFTEAGLVTSTDVPEPSSLLLLGAGLLGLAVLSGRRVLVA